MFAQFDNPPIHQDNTLNRASVLLKQSPELLGAILDTSPLQHRILKWLNHPSKLVLILPTSEGWQAEWTPPGINSTAKQDLNSGLENPKPTTLTLKPTPGTQVHDDWMENADGVWISLFSERMGCRVFHVSGINDLSQTNSLNDSLNTNCSWRSLLNCYDEQTFFNR